MPTITIKRKELDKLLGKKYPASFLKDRISMLGTDLEKLDNEEIIVEVFPNRPDMLSAQGLARALKSFISLEKGLKEYKVKDSKEHVYVEKSVKDIRPYTACAVVKGIHFDDEKIREIIQIQEKLHVTYGRNRRKVAIGIYPYEKIKPPIYFRALPPEKIKFRPLEADREMTALEILQYHPTGREYAHLLEGKKKFPIFVDSQGKILSMPPIINSHDTGKVTEQTRDVFIECSGFDFEVLKKCLNIIVTSLADMQGEIYAMTLHYGNKTYRTPDLKPEKMKINRNYINKILGLNLNEKQLKDCLERMGYAYKNGTVLIPAYRTDILHQIDLAEDVAIAYGYENFKPELPEIATIASDDVMYNFERKIAEILIGLGLQEVSTYHLVSENTNEKMNLNQQLVKLENSKSEEHCCLRSWLVPNLLSVLEVNKTNDYPQNIFEIGTVFKKDLTEIRRLAAVTCHSKANFTEIKQIFESLLRSLDLSYEIRETEHGSFIPGRVGRISVKGKDVAYIGEIHPAVLENYSLEMPVAAFELNLTEIFKLLKQ